MTLLPWTEILDRSAILDTETTDAKERDGVVPQVIELCYTYKGQEFVRRYMPDVPVRWGAIAVHHILPSELHGGLPSAMALTDAPVSAEFWIGHNVDFDWKMLGSPPVKRICTLALSREIWPEVDSHTLTAMTYFTRGANEATRQALRSAHSALADVEHCRALLETIIETCRIETLEQLYSLSEEARIPKKMSFGKFAGEPISAVDRGYANWYRKQADPDPYLLEAFKRQGLI